MFLIGILILLPRTTPIKDQAHSSHHKETEDPKTSPKKVKIASNKKRRKPDKNVPHSPSLKRLQPARMNKIAARASESSPRTRKSQNAFNYLLQSWENLSTRNDFELDSSSNLTQIEGSSRKPMGEDLTRSQIKTGRASDTPLDGKFGN